MKKEKPLVFALILVTLQFIIWVAFGYGVFVYTQSSGFAHISFGL